MKRTYSTFGAPPAPSGWARFSPLCATLFLCGLGLAFAPAASGATAFDAQEIVVTNAQGPVSGFGTSSLNPDGACAVLYWDSEREVFSIGRWTPAPLYGQPAGYTELYTETTNGLPLWNSNYAWSWAGIADNGEVTYALFTGREVGGAAFYGSFGTFVYGGAAGNGVDPCNGLFGWSWNSDTWWYQMVIDPYGASGGPGTSDPAPYIYGVAIGETQLAYTNPVDVYWYPYSCDGGLQDLSGPGGGDYALPLTLTKHGIAVWEVADVDDDQPGRQPGDRSYLLVTPAGTTDLAPYWQPGMYWFVDGQGDLAYGSFYTGNHLLLAAPLAGLAPGLHSQSEIAGMPPSPTAWSQIFNSSGTFLVSDLYSTSPYDWIITGGSGAPVENVLPDFVIGPGGVVLGNLNEQGLMTAYPYYYGAGGDRVPGPLYLVIPTLDCRLAPSVPPPYRLGQQFDLVVTVSNLTSAAITDLAMAGSPAISQSAQTFDISSGPSPAGPLTLEPGAFATFTYHCVAAVPGTATVTASIQATGPTGNTLNGQASTSVQVIQLEDLQIKLCTEDNTNYALVGVYQTTPSGQQIRVVELVNDDDVACFNVQVVNNEPAALPVTLLSMEVGSTNIVSAYLVGGQDVTAAITSPQGWTTPTLASGGSLLLTVQLGPSQAAASGDLKSAKISVVHAGGGVTLDVVLAEAVKAPPIAVTLRGPATAGFTSASVAAGTASGNLNAPLVLVTDPAALSQLPLVAYGLVADDVTPLLLQLVVSSEQFGGLPGPIQYNMTLEAVSGGTLGGTPLAQRLQLLDNGQWTSSTLLTFSSDQLTNFACVTPISADDLQLFVGSGQVELHLHFTRVGSGADAGEKTFYASKPPIALVHGYNTAGDWGEQTVSILQARRPANFVNTIKYGQEPAGASPQALQCTVLPLRSLAPMLRDQLESSMGQLTNLWAFTRYDVVAHSQGGLLTRMLCTGGSGNQWVADPFRSWKNFNRGRFHRVITIGSPHNGTRIVDYLFDLNQNGTLSLPNVLSYFMISSGVVQDKFEPFGWQIKALNQPSGDWVPDPDAQFHLVQATIDSGNPPSASSQSLGEILFGLNKVGSLVLPHGSDGVVDFDSMGAYTPEAGQSAGLNVFPMSPSLQISHASVPIPVGTIPGIGPVCPDLFCGQAGEVNSIDVAMHVIDTLNQNPAVASSARAFGPFGLPATLPSQVQTRIALAAQQIQLETPVQNAIVAYLLQQGRAKDQVAYAYTFVAPSGENIVGPVVWTAERYGAGGITTTGITVQDDSAEGNTNGVSVQFDNSVPGDVILYASAATDAGTVIVGAMTVVASIDPDTNTYSLDSTFISPSSGTYTVGDMIQPQFWATYDGPTNQLVLQRWVSPQTLAGNIYDTAGIMDFSNPLSWTFNNTGTTTVWVNWLGQNASATFTVYDSNVGGVDTDGDGVPDAMEAAVPGRNGQPQGDGNGDGTQDSQQRNVVSFICPSGQWLTLDTMATQDVQFCFTHLVSTPADTSLLPAPYAFDQGFLTLSAFNLNSDGSAVVRLFLPTNVHPDTVWAYGPEPTNSAPHWFQFMYDGVTGADIQPYFVYLHLLDGWRGDGDGLTNGAVNGLVFGLARAIPAPPSLQISAGSPGTVTLSWPAVFQNSANTFLETTGDLSSPSSWQFVPDLPLQTGGQNILAEPAGVSAQFYRLSSQ